MWSLIAHKIILFGNFRQGIILPMLQNFMSQFVKNSDVGRTESKAFHSQLICPEMP